LELQKSASICQKQPPKFAYKYCLSNPLKSQVLVTQAYNPNYSGSRDQEDHSSKPAPEANNLSDPILKKKKKKSGRKSSKKYLRL
jgi:hypothetical protein